MSETAPDTRTARPAPKAARKRAERIFLGLIRGRNRRSGWELLAEPHDTKSVLDRRPRP